jgi:hypothetical protein
MAARCARCDLEEAKNAQKIYGIHRAKRRFGDSRFRANDKPAKFIQPAARAGIITCQRNVGQDEQRNVGQDEFRFIPEARSVVGIEVQGY